MTQDQNPLKDTNDPKREQAQTVDNKTHVTLWLNKEERARIDELINLLEPYVKEEAEDLWNEFCEILKLKKEKGKPKTSFFPGEIISKERRTVRQKGERFGNVFYFFKLRVDGSDRKEIDFWAFESELDNKEQTWPIIERATLGERYEFEGHKWNKFDYYLRALTKLPQK